MGKMIARNVFLIALLSFQNAVTLFAERDSGEVNLSTVDDGIKHGSGSKDDTIKKGVIAVVVSVVALIAGGLWWSNRGTKNTNTTATSLSKNSSSSTSPSNGAGSQQSGITQGAGQGGSSSTSPSNGTASQQSGITQGAGQASAAMKPENVESQNLRNFENAVNSVEGDRYISSEILKSLFATMSSEVLNDRRKCEKAIKKALLPLVQSDYNRLLPKVKQNTPQAALVFYENDIDKWIEAGRQQEDDEEGMYSCMVRAVREMLVYEKPERQEEFFKMAKEGLKSRIELIKGVQLIDEMGREIDVQKFNENGLTPDFALIKKPEDLMTAVQAALTQTLKKIEAAKAIAMKLPKNKLREAHDLFAIEASSKMDGRKETFSKCMEYFNNNNERITGRLFAAYLLLCGLADYPKKDEVIKGRKGLKDAIVRIKTSCSKVQDKDSVKALAGIDHEAVIKDAGDDVEKLKDIMDGTCKQTVKVIETLAPEKMRDGTASFCLPDFSLAKNYKAYLALCEVSDSSSGDIKDIIHRLSTASKLFAWVVDNREKSE